MHDQRSHYSFAPEPESTPEMQKQTKRPFHDCGVGQSKCHHQLLNIYSMAVIREEVENESRNNSSNLVTHRISKLYKCFLQVLCEYLQCESLHYLVSSQLHAQDIIFKLFEKFIL